MKDTRPNTTIDFTKIKLPLPAITSIIHRISGGFIFFGLAVLLWLLSESLASEEGFVQVQQWLGMTVVKLVVWAILAGFLYHFIAGIKHLLMDLGIGETFEGAVTSAKIIMVLSAISFILAGLWIW